MAAGTSMMSAWPKPGVVSLAWMDVGQTAVAAWTSASAKMARTFIDTTGGQAKALAEMGASLRVATKAPTLRIPPAPTALLEAAVEPAAAAKAVEAAVEPVVEALEAAPAVVPIEPEAAAPVAAPLALAPEPVAIAKPEPAAPVVEVKVAEPAKAAPRKSAAGSPAVAPKPAIKAAAPKTTPKKG